MLTALLQAILAYLRRAAPQEPLQAPSGSPATTLAATLPDAVQELPGGVCSAAVGLVTRFEGFRAEPYRDPAGIWTFGYGSTHDAHGAPVCATTPPITTEQGAKLVARDLGAAADTVAHVIHVPLTENQKAALQDFVYNVGATAFASSTLARKLNLGDTPGAVDEFPKWNHAGGVVLAGLTKRRAAEQALFIA